MAIVCWGSLAKSASDNQRIEQNIEQYVIGHNANINAHQIYGSSLYMHKSNPALDHPAESVRYWHVKDLYAEAITAGGLVVKGGGPYISVQDQVGAERVKIYPEGIIVKKGKIVIENEGDNTIIDSLGVRGTNIFFAGQRDVDVEEQIKWHGNWYPISNLEFGVYLKRPTPVFISGNIRYQFQGFENMIHFRVMYPTGYLPPGWGWTAGQLVDWNVHRERLSFARVIQLYTGFNLVQVQANVDGIEYPSFLHAGDQVSDLAYMVLGN